MRAGGTSGSGGSGGGGTSGSGGGTSSGGGGTSSGGGGDIKTGLLCRWVPLGPRHANKAICVGVRVSGCTAVRQSDTMKIIILLSLLLATAVRAGPTIYKIDQEEGTAERVMTAVSSTGQFNPQPI